jgi:hypothetical protein
MRVKVTAPGTFLSVLLDEEITQEQFDSIHQLISDELPERVGALDLPFNEVGEIVQALGAALVDRGYSREQMVAALADWDESSFWGAAGPGALIDALEVDLDLQPGSCDTCGKPHENASNIDHCPDCGNCYKHCLCGTAVG